MVSFFYFHPYLEKWCNLTLTNILQMGGEHQLFFLNVLVLTWQKTILVCYAIVCSSSSLTEKICIWNYLTTSDLHRRGAPASLWKTQPRYFCLDRCWHFLWSARFVHFDALFSCWSQEQIGQGPHLGAEKTLFFWMEDLHFLFHFLKVQSISTGRSTQIHCFPASLKWAVKEHLGLFVA